MRVCMYVFNHVFMRVCTCALVFGLCVCVCTLVYVHVCESVCTYMCMCVYLCPIYVCMHTLNTFIFDPNFHLHNFLQYAL